MMIWRVKLSMNSVVCPVVNRVQATLSF